LYCHCADVGRLTTTLRMEDGLVGDNGKIPVTALFEELPVVLF
jgi:hypothetical protein